MATATVGPAPSAGLRDRILDAAKAEPQNVVSLDERRRSRLMPVLGIAAAVAACAALALGLWGASVASDLDDARSALARERAAAAILAQPASEASLTGARGRLVVGDDGQAVLVVSDVPPVPAGKTYQVWVIDDGNPVSGGLFAPTDGTQAIPVDGSVGNGSVVAVTVEDSGGAAAPTGKPVIASAPVSVS
jgi:anti-sigma-K factor RskA